MKSKAALEAEIKSLQAELRQAKLPNQRLLDHIEEERARHSVLITQDNALIHLLEEILQIEVHAIESPTYARWEDRKIVWGFFQLPDREELHRNESLSEGYRAVWAIEQEVRRMRKEDKGERLV
jgi:hypothetical protein